MDKINVPNDILRFKKREKKDNVPKKIFFTDKQEIPGRIVVYLNDKVNLEQLDRVIKYKFTKLKTDISKNYKKLENLKLKINDNLIQSEKLDILNKIKDEEEFIEKIVNEVDLKKYIYESKKFLERENNLKNSLEYLEIAKNYVNIETIKKIENSVNCVGCGESLEDIEEDKEGMFTCENCNCINDYIKPTKYVKDTEHHLANNDDDISNFIKTLSKFEGKNVSSIPDVLFVKLDEYFINNGMEKGIYYKKQKLNDEGKKKNTSKKKMWKALEKLSYNQYYDEINYITHIYWGWELPDLTLYRAMIIRDYQITQKVWQRIKKDYKRSASLGTSFRLLSHLKAVGYPYCKREDFKIQDMVDSLRLHNDAWRRMCEETGVKFYPVN